MDTTFQEWENAHLENGKIRIYINGDEFLAGVMDLATGEVTIIWEKTWKGWEMASSNLEEPLENLHLLSYVHLYDENHDENTMECIREWCVDYFADIRTPVMVNYASRTYTNDGQLAKRQKINMGGSWQRYFTNSAWIHEAERRKGKRIYLT